MGTTLFWLVFALFAVTVTAAQQDDPDAKCVNAQDGSPPPLTWDWPMWRWTDNKLCPAQNQLDSAGLCFHALKPIDNQTCAAWCITSQGWFHGKPIDLMVGEMCEQHNPCHRSVTIGADNSHEVSESFEKTRSTRNIDTDTKSNSTTHSTGISQSFSLSFSAGVSQGGDKGTAAAGVKADWETRMEDSMKWDKTDSRSVANSVESAFSLTENHVTRHSITLSLSVGTTRGGHIGMTYCGSWFAVPKVYFRCGNMAVGDFHDRGCHSNESRKGPVCELWVKIDSYSKGPPMGHSDTTPDNIEGERRFTRTVQHSQVFVRRDCDTGEILPPAFQDEAFRHSLSFYDYMSEHMTRFDDWTRKTHSSVRIARNGRDMKRMYGASRPVPSLTLTAAEDRAVGPANNYTIQVCMREGLNNPSNWCAYHKLPDRRCFTFGRGALEAPYTKIASAEVTPGNCCVLFSRHECLGIPQRVTGRIESFYPFDYQNKAHSVICNVPEYCSRNVRESANEALQPSYS